MRFEELYARRQRRELTMAEAGEMLGVTERTFRRWCDRYEGDGAAGLQDQRIGRPSARAVPVDDALRMVTLYETRDTGWTVKHFHERWHAELWRDAVVDLDEAGSAGRWAGGPRPPARRASQETAP